MSRLSNHFLIHLNWIYTVIYTFFITHETSDSNEHTNAQVHYDYNSLLYDVYTKDLNVNNKKQNYQV